MPNELVALGAAFLSAAVLARVGRRVGLPTIPFFIIAGIVTGPHTPGPVLFEDPADLELFAAVGLILLLFHLGLEFSPEELTKGPRIVLTGALHIALKLGGGLAFGFLLGWGAREAFVIAGAIAVSSSAIVTKLLLEQRRMQHPETPMILGIIIVEDVFLALYLAFLEPLLGDAQGVGEGLLLFGRAFAFLVALFAVARFGSRVVGRLVTTRENELLTLMFIGTAVLVAGVAEELGVSAAIGGLMAGIILAQTAVAPRVERLVLPLRDAFGAVFFFAFGLTIDPGAVDVVLWPVIIAVLLTLALNILAGAIGARINRLSREGAASTGLTLLGRGEFSLILATLAAAAGLDGRIGPFVAIYVLILAVAGPLLASRSGWLARLLPTAWFPSIGTAQTSTGPAAF